MAPPATIGGALLDRRQAPRRTRAVSPLTHSSRTEVVVRLSE